MIIPGFEKYDITTDGVVTRVATGHTLKTRIVHVHNSPAIYKVVTLECPNGKYVDHNLLRLLAITYLGPPPKAAFARAKDGNNLNTVLSNVEWVTRNSVSKTAWDSGKMDHRSKRKGYCTTDSIRMLKDTLMLYDKPVTMTELAAELQVPYGVVRYSMLELRRRGYVRKTPEGFEVIR